MKTVLIFRHQLFKNSEPFIAQQAERLRSFRPVYLGRERMGEAPLGAESAALSDRPGEYTFPRRVRLVVSRDPRPYVRLLGNLRPALIHAHFGVDAVYALQLARLAEVPLITTFHGFDATVSSGALLASGSLAWCNYVLHRGQLARQGQLFICVSEFVRSRVRALGFPEERTRVHYIGVDTEAILPRTPDEEEPIVLHVARLVEKKGTAYLLQAFARCARRHPEFRLVIIGEGPLLTRLQTLARQLSLGEQVTFVGAVSHENAVRWMRRASILALPSVEACSGDAEGLGMVLLEAAAQAVPLLGTRHGGIPEVIVDGETGYLVPERDPTSLSERLEDLLKNRELRRRMGLRGRAVMEERFDHRRQTAKLETLYQGVISCDGK